MAILIWGKPNTFLVGGEKYPVQYERLTKTGYHGQHCTSPATLKINNEDQPIKQVKTLVHELLHAVCATHGILSAPHQSREQEELVRKLEPAIYDLLKNNDFSWVKNEELFEQVKPKRSWLKRLFKREEIVP